MIIDLSLSIVAMGAIYYKDSRSTGVNFITWLKEQGLNPSMQQGRLTKVEDIVNLLWDLDLSKYGSEHVVDFDFKADWGQPNETFFGGNISFHPNSNQFTVRMNILPPERVKNEGDYDNLAEKVAQFAETLHRKIQAKVTVVDRNKTRVGSNAYNVKGLPLWIGWYSFYDLDLRSKYNVLDNTSDPFESDIINKKEVLIIRSTRKWSEYHRYGWGNETRNHLKSLGGRLLNNKID
ncbi:MAG: hypothetical protein HY376_02810 [Candidatus Blackburnbacteria bacterium]|nr:hypothetical protein [Candidatus Blackburnbacteria bacterium]